MDINVLKAYEVEILPYWLNVAFNNIQKFNSFDEWFNNEIKWIDCTKVGKDGMRYNQTINFNYNKELTEIMYCIEHTDNINKDEYYEKLLKQHEINLQYEKINPPIIYGNRRQKSAIKKRVENQKIKQSKLELDNKESAAERKLKAKAAKLNNLSFNINIKPIN